VHKSNNQWEKEGGWGDSKSNGLHVMNPATAAACRFVKTVKFPSAVEGDRGLDTPSLINSRARKAVHGVQTIMRNKWLVVDKDERVLLSGRCAREGAAASARHCRPALLSGPLLRLLKMVEDGPANRTRMSSRVSFDNATWQGNAVPCVQWQAVAAPWATPGAVPSFFASSLIRLFFFLILIPHS